MANISSNQSEILLISYTSCAEKCLADEAHVRQKGTLSHMLPQHITLARVELTNGLLCALFFLSLVVIVVVVNALGDDVAFTLCFAYICLSSVMAKAAFFHCVF